MEALIFGRHVPLPACRESRFLSAKPLSFNGSREALFSSLERTTARGEPRWGLLLPGPPFVVWSGTGDFAGGGSDWGVRLPVPLGRQRVLIRNLLRFALAAVSCLRRLGPGDLRFVVGGKAARSLSTRLVRLRPRSSSGLAPMSSRHLPAPTSVHLLLPVISGCAGHGDP